MNRINRIIGIAVIFVAAMGSTLPADPVPVTADSLRAVERQVQRILPEIRAATVALRFASGGAGSGVLVSPDGLILTAGHVSGTPGRVAEVILEDGRRFRGKSLGRNGVEDAGMIQIEFEEGSPVPNLPTVTLGRSSTVEPGTWVVALGHPGGWRSDRPAVLRVGRVIRQGIFIQTDAVLVGGDSGGPLFTLDGKLIGIHSRIGAPNHDNRHVPIDKFTATWERLAAGEDWNPIEDAMGWLRNSPWLGVAIEDDPAGARITLVDQAGPAREAGLQPGDIITSFNGKQVVNADDLRTLIRSSKIGENVEIGLIRESGEADVVSITLSRRPAP
ncbi:MAG: S1C family serine protease [Phycisphaerae bacterium]|nr:S1C family serine protease [Phycisphaerae bacterium]MDW8262002.1 trypsin-like peptidase domain-containing protein [Phycisphaerales bacterium]